MTSLRHLRHKAGIKTIKEAAKRLGISTSMMYQIEAGKRKPSIGSALKMRDLYKCELKDIQEAIEWNIK